MSQAVKVIVSVIILIYRTIVLSVTSNDMVDANLDTLEHINSKNKTIEIEVKTLQRENTKATKCLG